MDPQDDAGFAEQDNLDYEDGSEEDEEDDFLPSRRKYSDEDDAGDGNEEEIPAKRQRYSPSVSNGHSTQMPPFEKPKHTLSASHSHALVPPGAKPALEHSIINVEPIDEFIKEVADFIHRLIANRRQHVEIEAKIGVLKDSTGQRIRLPVTTETSKFSFASPRVSPPLRPFPKVILSEAIPVRFESNMSAVCLALVSALIVLKPASHRANTTISIHYSISSVFLQVDLKLHEHLSNIRIQNILIPFTLLRTILMTNCVLQRMRLPENSSNQSKKFD